jgi:hypothetical protein
MKLVKNFIPAVLLFVSLSVLVSCEKDKTTTPATVTTYPLQGLWTGTSLAAGSTGTIYYSFIIKPDGTMIVDSKPGTVQHISIGTWTQSGTTVSYSYTCIYGSSGSIGLIQSGTGTWDNTGKLSGTWQNVNGVTANGTLTLTRIN